MNIDGFSWPQSLSKLTWATSLLMGMLFLGAWLIVIRTLRPSARDYLLISQRVAYIALIAVFFLGSYSALAALIAVSWRQTNSLSEAQAERIFSDLAAMEKPEPLTQVNNMLRLADSSPNLFDSVTASLNRDHARVIWESEEKGFYEFIEQVRSFQTQHEDAVQIYNNYVTEIVPNVVFSGTLEAEKLRTYRLAVKNYQDETVRALNAASREFTTKASNIESALRDNLRAVTRDLNSRNQQMDINFYISKHAKYTSLNNDQPIEERLRTAFNLLDNLPSEIRQPSPPQLLEAWGPLRGTVAWLIKPNSTDLLNVLGMVGFAILGSSLTCFVSAGNRKLRNPRMRDVIAVVIKGTTAALVVYLFIFGGFEIFSISDAPSFRPNVFMLFLTCFLGAVFSDQIWKYAEKRLIDSLKHSPSSSKP